MVALSLPDPWQIVARGQPVISLSLLLRRKHFEQWFPWSETEQRSIMISNRTLWLFINLALILTLILVFLGCGKLQNILVSHSWHIRSAGRSFCRWVTAHRLKKYNYSNVFLWRFPQSLKVKLISTSSYLAHNFVGITLKGTALNNYR